MTCRRTTSLTLFLVASFILLAAGCNLLSSSDKEPLPEPGFSYEVTDERGVLTGNISDREIDEIEVETGVGLFGNDFFPPEILETVAEQIGANPELFKRNEIILHAESGVEGEVHFASLRFRFPKAEPLNTGSYQIFSLTEEQLIQSLRTIWEFRRGQRPFNNLRTAGNRVFNSVSQANDFVNINYFEFGFGLQSRQHAYFSKGGSLELQSVSEERVIGSFSVELIGVPVLIFELEEFPDKPDLRKIQINGEFTAEPGDFEDLKQLRFDLLNDFGLPFIPLF